MNRIIQTFASLRKRYKKSAIKAPRLGRNNGFTPEMEKPISGRNQEYAQRILPQTK